jgi:hypothetical protein
MAPRIQLPQRLAERLDLDGLQSLILQLGAGPGDFGHLGASALARELVLHARRRGRTDRLLAAAVRLNPALTAHDFLYLLLADYFDGQELAGLCRNLALDCAALRLDADGLRGYDHDRFIKEERAFALQEAMAASRRSGELIEAISRAKPDLDLSSLTAPDARGQLVEAPAAPRRAARPGPRTAQDFDLRVGVPRDGAVPNGPVTHGPVSHGPVTHGRYPIEVQRSPVGEMDAPEWRESPLSDPEFDRLFRSLRDLALDPDGLTELGRKLYAFLFGGRAGTMLERCLDQAADVLRIRLRLDPPELSRLPWEYCYHHTEEFFALNPLTPVVRFSAQPFAALGLAVPEPVRILVAMASPEGMPPLKIEDETGLIRQALEPLGDKVTLDLLQQASVEKLQTALARGYHVLHFIGHGVFRRATGEGALALEDHDRQVRPLNARGLRQLLRGRGIRLVILNACNTAAHDATDALMGVAPSLAAAKVPAVLAMQFKVPDTTALLFSQTLYNFLAGGHPLDVAVTEMRLAASLRNLDRPDWGTPALYMRAPDGYIWA